MGFSPTVSGGSSTPAKWGKHFGYNLDSAMTAYRNKLANVSSQLVNILCIGDSTTQGDFSSNVTTKSWPGVLRTALQSRYPSGNSTNGFGLDNNALTSVGSGWSWSSMQPAFKCVLLTCTSATTTAATFTVTGTSITLLYAVESGGGTANITIDGAAPGTNATLNCGGASTDFSPRLTWTGLSNASHTLTITANGNGPLYIQGVISTNASSGYNVDNVGKGSSLSTTWDATNTYSSWTHASYDLVFISLGYNDLSKSSNSTTNSNWQTHLNTYTTSLTNIARHWTNAGSSVVLVPLHRPDDGFNQWWPDVVKQNYSVADSVGCGLIDLYQATLMSADFLHPLGYFGTGSNGLGGTSAGSPYTPPYSDVHPSDFGYQWIARVIEAHLI